jgi:GNAT superfamily N-acetyltransferase
MHAAVLSAQRHFSWLVGGASEDAACFEREGVLAAVVPVAAERSVVNAATYEHPDALRDAYHDLAAAYEQIGGQWTVWVHHDDAQTAALLAERGHVLDSQPEAMARTLASPPSRPPLEGWTAEGSMEDVGRLNDAAYGYAGSLRRALGGVAGDGLRVYVCPANDKPVGCLVTLDDGSNTDIDFVAVRPEARGRGLSGKLLAHALADAADRGQETSTLVATTIGRPVYERLGYRALGALQMWERRRLST